MSSSISSIDMRCLLLVIVVPGDRQGIGPYSSLGAWQSRPFYFTNAPVPDLCPVEFPAHLTNARPYRARTKTGAPWKHDSGPAAMVGGRDSTSRPLRLDLSPQPLKATYATRSGGSHLGKDRYIGQVTGDQDRAKLRFGIRAADQGRVKREANPHASSLPPSAWLRVNGVRPNARPGAGLRTRRRGQHRQCFPERPGGRRRPFRAP